MSSNDSARARPAAPLTARRQRSVGRRRIVRYTRGDGGVVRRSARDQLCAEEPLEIVRSGAGGGEPIALTMRTPGADFDLVAGLLLAEGWIDGAEELVAMRYCDGSGGAGPSTYNRIEVRLAGAAGNREGAIPRERVTTSSCGVCSLRSIEEVEALGCPTVDSSLRVAPGVLLELPLRLRDAQSLFDRTGGLHAAALFDPAGELVCIREDVGRHNAMDKVVGAALLAGELPLRDRVLLMSGRLGFDLVQKAARAGVPVVAGVSAPSTLAVELAERVGITLVGFLREQGFNVYTGGERIAPE